MVRTIEMVSVADLNVDFRYQREVNTALVAKIVKHYHEPLFSPLLVAERRLPDGTSSLYVVDGQHRLEAAKQLGIESVPCFVYKNMSPADEADLFVNQQAATCRLTPRDTYKANIFIGNPQNIDVIIDKTLKQYKHRIGVHSHDSNGWYAIVSLRELVERDGADMLAKVLTVLNELNWLEGRAAHSRLMLIGIAHALRSGCSLHKLIELLDTEYHTPQGFIDNVAATCGGRKPTVVVTEVIDRLIKQG